MPANETLAIKTKTARIEMRRTRAGEVRHEAALAVDRARFLKRGSFTVAPSPTFPA
jgi:hypothetical protein